MTTAASRPGRSAAPLRGWPARACARLGGLCALLRAAHLARIPF